MMRMRKVIPYIVTCYIKLFTELKAYDSSFIANECKIFSLATSTSYLTRCQVIMTWFISEPLIILENRV